ncbi:transposase [Nocardia speluncae]|uniref:Transposase n=1 Tax=Nocardia speluncae TaxID=419477 RepID=A0A846XLR6_9NOCA|nr:transposase [Nocardia speluncae]
MEDRQILNVMLYKAETGAAWRELPNDTGLGKRSTTKFWQWSRIGTSVMLMQRVPVIAEAMDEPDREVAVDSRSYAFTSTRPVREPAWFTQGGNGSGPGPSEPFDHAVGRSCGGPTTNINRACDGHGRPSRRHLSNL